MQERDILDQENVTYTLPPEVSNALDEAIFSSQDTQQVLNFVLDTALNLLHADYGSLWWVNRRTKKMTVMAARYHSGQISTSEDSQDLDLDGDSVIAQVIRTKKSLDISDWLRVYYRLDSDAAMRSELAVPLLSSDRKVVVGVLNVKSQKPNAFLPQDQTCLSILARRVWMVVQRDKLSKAIQTIGQKVIAQDEDALLTYVVEALSDLMNVPVCSIWLVDQETEELILKKTIGRTEPTDEAPDVRLSRQSFIGRVLDARKTVSSLNVQKEQDFAYRDLAKKQGWVSALAVPILCPNGTVLGVISVYSVNEERNFADHDCDLALSFSNQVAVALQQAYLFDEREKNFEKMSALQRISDALITTENLNDLLQLIVEQAVYFLKGAGGILYLSNESRKQNIVVAAVGTAETVKGMHTPLDGSLSGWVTLNNEPVLCKENDPRIDWNIAGRLNLSNIAAAPLILEDKIIGTLVIIDNKSTSIAQFDQKYLDFLQILSANITVAIKKMHIDEQSQRRSEQLRVINAILFNSLSSTNIDALLREVVLQISHSFSYGVGIGMIDQNKLVFKAIVSHNSEFCTDPIILSLGEGITGSVAVSGEPMIIPDVKNEPFYYEFYSDTRSELVVPLLTPENAVVGVLNVESKDLGAFSQEDVELFQAIATGITLAIENARRLKGLTALHKISTAVIRAHDLNQILDNCVGTVIELFNASASAVYLSDPDSRYLNLYHHTGYPEAVVERVQRIDWGKSIAGRVLQTGDTIVVQDMTTDLRADGTVMPEDDLHSLVDVPIKTDKRIMGVLAVLTKDVRVFTDHEVSILESIGNNIGIAIEKAQLAHQISEAERKYRRLFQRARDSILVLDLDGDVVDANQEASRVSGYTYDELIGKNILDFVSNDEMVSSGRKRLDQLYRGEEVPMMEFTLTHKKRFYIIH